MKQTLDLVGLTGCSLVPFPASPVALEWVRVCTLKDVASPRNGETHFWPVSGLQSVLRPLRREKLPNGFQVMLPGLSARDHFFLQVSRGNHMGLRHKARGNGKDCDEDACHQRSDRLPHITHFSESPLHLSRHHLNATCSPLDALTIR